MGGTFQIGPCDGIFVLKLRGIHYLLFSPLPQANRLLHPPILPRQLLFFKELSNDAIDTVVDSFFPAPGRLCAVAIEQLGGAVSRIGERDTAFSHRHVQHSVLTVAEWEEPSVSAKNIEWARRLYSSIQPFLEDGVYVN